MNHQKTTDLLLRLASNTRHEPRTQTHDGLTHQVAPWVIEKMPAGTRALDIGCGSGPFLALCKDRGMDAVGITVDKYDLTAAIANGFKAHQMDMHDLQFKDEEFGLVWLRHSLEHSPFPLLALAEAKRVLRPDGIIYVEVPAGETCCNHESNPNHYSIFTDKSWQWLFFKAELDLDDVRSWTITLKDLGDDRYWSYILKHHQ